MSNFDDIFDPGTSAALPEEPFDKEKWAEKKQTERKSVYELADSTAEAISSDGNRFREYLDVQSRFDRYSALNALLITAQMPGATQLKDFDGWKEAGASIKKQQKGICILAPGEEYTREDNTIGTSYNVKKVFDVSQTTDKAKVRPNVQHDERTMIAALISGHRGDISVVDDLAGRASGAFFEPESGKIYVRRGLEFQDLFRALSIELSHMELAAVSDSYSRENTGFTAYCSSYIVCKKNSIDVSGYDFSVLPDNLREGDAQSIRAVLTDIRDTAETISGRIAKSLEQSREPKSKEQER